jgi:hypothetical protein
MNNEPKEKMCCICDQKKATNIPVTDNKPYYINMGACDNPACILMRMRQLG